MPLNINSVIEIILIAIFGGLAGSIVSFFVTRWSTNKQVEAAEGRLRKEMLYENRKKALKKLFEIVKKDHDNFSKFESEINEFLNSFESEYLPDYLEENIRNEINEVNEFMEEAGLRRPSPSEDQIKKWTEEYQDYLEGLPNYKRAEKELDDKFRGMEESIKESISKELEP